MLDERRDRRCFDVGPVFWIVDWDKTLVDIVSLCSLGARTMRLRDRLEYVDRSSKFTLVDALDVF